MKTKQNKVELFRTHIAGLQYYDYQRSFLVAGDKLTLTHERSNAHDANAIRIDIRRSPTKVIKLGYVPANLTHILHYAHEEGAKLQAEIVSVNPNNPSWHHIVFVVFAVYPKQQKVQETDIEY